MSNTRRSIYNKIWSFVVSPLPEKVNSLELAFYRLKGIVYYRRVFGSFGSGSVLYKPMMLSNPRFIHIGKNVVIRKGVRLEVIVSSSENKPCLFIGNNVNLEQNVHIVCHSRVIIGDEVTITGHCAIVDVTHPYQNVHDPLKIGDRILAEKSFVEIGDRSFIGFGTAILPNVCVGSYCIIGAHSLVTQDISDYSVASGNPAKVKRRFNADTEEWIQEADSRNRTEEVFLMEGRLAFDKVRRFMTMRMPERLSLLSRLLLKAKAALYYRHIFGSFGRGSTIGQPILLTNPHFMQIGSNVNIRRSVRLEAVACDQTYTPELRIGDNVNIEHFVQISSIGRLVIGQNVSIGSRTMILCGHHPFFDVTNPVKIGDRLAGKNAFIEIGDGTFIGAGVAITQNVRIGRNVVIGANSVVKNSIPDYCVVDGNPAMVVMRYDEIQGRWITIKRN